MIRLARPRTHQADIFAPTPIDQIEQRRVKLDVSIEAVCRAAHLSSRTYYYLLQGHTRPTALTIQKLTRALDMLTPEPAEAEQ